MEYFIHIATLSGIYSLAALGLNYASGFTGLISLNHGAFMGIGAYAVAYFMKLQGWGFWPSLGLAMLITGIIAWLISWPLLRLRDDAFVLVSFVVSFIAYNVFLNWTSVTNGAVGLKGIPAPDLPSFMTYELAFFALVLLLLALSYLLLRLILNSSYGVVVKATRENQKVTQIAGHNTDAYRRSVFVISGMVTAIAGALLATYISAIDPLLFTFHLSVLLLMMVILGGLASLPGSVIGATLLIILPELLRFLGLPNEYLAEARQIAYGLVLIVLMLYRPKGLFGKYSI